MFKMKNKAECHTWTMEGRRIKEKVEVDYLKELFMEKRYIQFKSMR